MGFGFRKSFKLGKGTRLNLSKSGLGISYGVKGCRFSTNGKGTTFYGGANGLYYRKKFGRRSKISTSSSTMIEDVLEDIEEHKIAIKDDFNFFMDINEKYKLKALERLINFEQSLGCLGCVTILLVAFIPFILIIFLILFLLYSYLKRKNKFNVVFSEIFENFCKSFEKLGDSNVFYNINGYPCIIGKATLKDYLPDAIPYMQYSKNKLYFLNESLIIYSPKNIFFKIPYSQITTNFEETSAKMFDAPENTEIISSTWEHVNKDGSPSRRYKVNREIFETKAYILEINCKENFNIPLVIINKEIAEILYKDINKIIVN